MIAPHAFDMLCREHPAIGFTLLRNIAADVAAKLRQTTTKIVRYVLKHSHLRALCEEISSSLPQPDAITPIRKTIVIRDSDGCILSGAGRISAHEAETEEIAVFLFSKPGLLGELADQREPAGEVIFNVLFSLIRCGQLPVRVDQRRFTFRLSAGRDRRSGTLVVAKGAQEPAAQYTLEWKIKGLQFDATTATTRAYLFVHVYTDAADSPYYRAEEMMAGIDMPVQCAMYATLRGQARANGRFRVFTVHHRTHEVARTLRTLHQLGYQLDTFVGIPYGEASWNTIALLECASAQHYASLRALRHPTKPTTYAFDFMQSSFLDAATEREITEIFDDRANTESYSAAMRALIRYQLGKLIARCRTNGERLLVYEDGGYVVPEIYDIYADPTHRLHTAVKAAVDERLIVGAVEVTTAGERKQRAAIAANGGVALLPVLSCARDDIKTIYESIGTAEAILTAAATALGNLGLPTFELRRVAVIGGNGAIGTRIVEKLTLAHNSTGNVFAVDVVAEAFSQVVSGEAFPDVAAKVTYQPIKRYMVEEHCLPIILNLPFATQDISGSEQAIRAAVHDFLGGDEQFDELALTNSLPLSPAFVASLWDEIAHMHGYRLEEAQAIDEGMIYRLRRDDRPRTVTLLRPHVVLTFKNINRLIQGHIDTVIGITGLPIFSDKDLDAFLARKGRGGEDMDDVLVLISGSSKDYEFSQVIVLLNNLLALHADSFADTEEQLAWFKDLYRQQMSFVQDEDFDAISGLLADSCDPRAWRKLIGEHPELAATLGMVHGDVQRWCRPLAQFIRAKIRRNLTIHKEIRPDIGSIYHLTVCGKRKRIVLVADGFVVNFYATYEKGVKTEYMDPVMTMQMLGLVKLSGADGAVEPGLYRMADQLRREDMDLFWAALEEQSRPLSFG